MGLRLKFNLVLVACFAVGLAVVAGLSLPLMQQNARSSVMESARIMMESASAIRGYTSDQIQPLLEPLMVDQFLPHSVPSYAAQTNFLALRAAFPEYSYKEAALNPTNLADRATDWEADIIRTFRNDRARTELTLVRDTPTGQSLVLARPLEVTETACLACHGNVADAPPAMLAIYGTGNGFGWQVGEVIGAQVVSVPMAVAQERAWMLFGTLIGAMAAVFLVIGLLLNIVLGRMVLRPVDRIARMADAASQGRGTAAEIRHPTRDEIGRLAAAVDRLRRAGRLS